MAEKTNTKQTYTIDAAGKTLGRVASEAAKALMGKKWASYTPHIRSDIRVEVQNASKLRIMEKKRAQKVYNHYTQYPGGFKQETLANLSARKGYSEAVRRAVRRMLPRNTMLTARLKNLIVSE